MNSFAQIAAKNAAGILFYQHRNPRAFNRIYQFAVLHVCLWSFAGYKIYKTSEIESFKEALAKKELGIVFGFISVGFGMFAAAQIYSKKHLKTLRLLPGGKFVEIETCQKYGNRFIHVPVGNVYSKEPLTLATTSTLTEKGKMTVCINGKDYFMDKSGKFHLPELFNQGFYKNFKN